MAKFVDFYSDREVQDIMEAFIEKFPMIFDGFDASKIGFVTVKEKKGKHSKGSALKLKKVAFPESVWINKAYILVSSAGAWNKLDQKRKNLSVWKIMCSIPQGAFDEQSKSYGKILQPDIKMFMKEFAATGGVPNWEENPAALDPMDQTTEEIVHNIPVSEAIPSEDGVDRKAVTMNDVSNVQTNAKV